MMQIPGFLPIPTPWLSLDEIQTNQYVQWLNAFTDYMNRHSNLFSHQSVHLSLSLNFHLFSRSRITILLY